jgi:serine/threonine protein kinase/Flp pilus assembly protein TadD
MAGDDNANRERAIFEAALDLTSTQGRLGYLKGACGGDAALLARVQALLQAHETAGGFLPEQPKAAAGATVRIVSEKAGDKIGHYKLLQEIGEGGCGVVYMAEQQEPIRRRVALKVIKLGMDTKQVIARFEAERQALALMHHPNIAKVLDAGTTDTGRPYFVMELVRGVKITNYCDENHLTTQERLKLFVQICHAIQHAHQKGIIHRDIKPSNILVTINDGVPVPKVIDFGIAKAIGQQLTDKTVYTAFEQFIGTPAYMSPEQAVMTSLDVDTRSDVYALGVLLYELLTGHTPFEPSELLAAGLDRMRRMICEQEPVRPSTRLSTLAELERTNVAKRRSSGPPQLVHLLRGDLDWIVMKCLEKDRTRRYETANGLADDVTRHLNNEPVAASPPSRLYRLQKLARRNKVAFAAGAAVTAALVLGLGLSTWLFLREQAAHARAVAAEMVQSQLRQQAQTEARKSEQVAQFLKDMLRGVGPSVALGRDTTMLKEILDKTAERVGKDLKDQPEVEAELRGTIGDVYWALSLYTNAETMHRAALTIRRSLWGNLNTNVADSLDGLARALQWQKWQPDQAEPLFQEALNIRTNLLGAEHPKIAASLFNLGYVRACQGRYPEAERFFRQSLAMRRKLLGNDSVEVAQTLSALSSVLYVEGQLVEAESAVREALAIRTRISADEPIWDEQITHARLGVALYLQHRLDEAEIVLRQAVTSYRKVLGTEHPDIVGALRILARVLLEKGQLAEAQTRAQEAVLMSKRLFGAQNPNTAVCLDVLGSTLRKAGKLAEAEGAFREELAVWEQQAASRYNDNENLARAELVAVLQSQGKSAEAEKLLAEVLKPAAQAQPEGIGALRIRINLSGRQGRWKDAVTDLDKLLEVDPSDAHAHLQLAAVLAETGDLEAYRAHCRKMLARFGGTNDAAILDQTAKACLLVPGAGGDLEAASQLAGKAVTLGKDSAWFSFIQFGKGLAEYRRGDYASAVDWMRKVIGQPVSVGGPLPAWERDVAAWAVLAMAQHQMKQSEEARAALAKASQLAQTKLPQLSAENLEQDWVDWLIAQILLREAQALVAPLSGMGSAAATNAQAPAPFIESRNSKTVTQ